jgi:hypothetical protein
MKKHIYLASLLSMGILSVTQPASAFTPPYPTGAKTEKKVEAKVEAKIIIQKDQDGNITGFKMEGVDPVLTEKVLENAFDFLNTHDAYYTSGDEKDDTGGGGDNGDKGGTDGDPKAKIESPCDNCWTEDEDGKVKFYLESDKKVEGKDGYTDDNPLDDNDEGSGGSADDAEDDFKRNPQ